MLNAMDFATQIAQEVGGEIRVVEKANGIKLTGIMFPTATPGAMATVYAEDFIEKGLDVADAVQEIRRIMEREANTEINLDFLDDFENVKPRLSARLYNKATNAEVFRSADRYGFNDLIITAHIRTDINGGYIRVTQALLDRWNVTADEVLDIAESNSKQDAVIEDLFAVLKAAMGAPDEILRTSGPEMLVITNESKCYGAYSIIAKLDELKAKYPGGFVVLPSSVHEVLVVPMQGEQDVLDSMVQEVNDTQLKAEEVLADHAYIIA